MKKALTLGCGIGGTLLTSCGGLQNKNVETILPQKPNVIFIVADDIGYGDLSCYGEKTIHTPNVDKLAAGGLRFTDAHAVAATSTPSRYSLFTGHYNWRRNDTGIAAGNAGMIIRPEQTTVADIFKNAGYATGAIGKWHLGMGDETGTQNWNGLITPGAQDIGFDYSYLMAATGDRVPCVWVENQRVANYDSAAPIYVSYEDPFPDEPLGRDHPELLTKLKPSLNHGHDQAIVNGISRIGYMKGGGDALWEDENIADSITIKAVEFIENHTDIPFFLYVGTNDIHVPRYPHPRFVGKSGMGYRGDAILQFDWTVGEIVKILEKKGLMENTLIILTSDNGPVVDDGYQDQAVELLGDHRPWGDLRGGKYSNFEAGTRVPFIVSWAKHIKPDVSGALVSHIDLFASMAALIGEDVDQAVAIDSQNQLSTILGADQKGRDYIIESSSSLSISNGEWKYITPNNGSAFYSLTKTESGNSKEEQLYYLKEDIGEKNNLAKKYPEKISELKLILDKEKEKGYLRKWE
ncbi:MAG: sulfatase-like hydrolase/transferase [Prevotella sp.]|jgi:arylsulfatase A-like enzyme|nr:sulfatase-like hydrolase/transferase [Prevotella sp.]